MLTDFVARSQITIDTIVNLHAQLKKDSTATFWKAERKLDIILSSPLKKEKGEAAPKRSPVVIVLNAPASGKSMMLARDAERRRTDGSSSDDVEAVVSQQKRRRFKVPERPDSMTTTGPIALKKKTPNE